MTPWSGAIYLPFPNSTLARCSHHHHRHRISQHQSNCEAGLETICFLMSCKYNNHHHPSFSYKKNPLLSIILPPYRPVHKIIISVFFFLCRLHASCVCRVLYSLTLLSSSIDIRAAATLPPPPRLSISRGSFNMLH